MLRERTEKQSRRENLSTLSTNLGLIIMQIKSQIDESEYLDDIDQMLIENSEKRASVVAQWLVTIAMIGCFFIYIEIFKILYASFLHHMRNLT